MSPGRTSTTQYYTSLNTFPIVIKSVAVVDKEVTHSQVEDPQASVMHSLLNLLPIIHNLQQGMVMTQHHAFLQQLYYL